MTMKLTKIFLFFLIVLLQSNIVYAQQTSQTLYNIYVALLGKLPEVCGSSFLLASPCLECMAIAKFAPLVVFTLIFYMAFYFILKHMVSWRKVMLERGQEVWRPDITPMEQKIILTLSIVFGLFLLHTEQVQSGIMQVKLWGGVMIAGLIILSVGSFSRWHGWWLVVILLILLFLFVYPLMSNSLGSVVNYYQVTCM